MAFIYDLADTWNSDTTTFTGIKLNVTDSASTVGSLLMDLQVGGSSYFTLRKDGRLEAGVAANRMIFNPATRSLILQNNAGETNGGIRYFGNSSISMVAGSQYSSTFVGNGMLNAATGFVGWHSSNYSWEAFTADLRLHRDAANTLAQRNGTNAQGFNIYNTYTDTNNYERGYFTADANGLTIGHQALGTGLTRPVRIAGPSFYLGGPDTAGVSAVITASAATDLITWNNHGLVTGSPVRFTNSGGGLPGNIRALGDFYPVVYYAVVIDANTFKIATNYNFATAAVPTTVNISTDGTGTTTATAAQVLQSLFVQNFTGTDVLGAPLIINGSQGTGTSPGGNIVFRTSNVSTTGSSANRLTDLMVLNSTERCVDIHAAAGGDAVPAFRIFNAAGSQATYMSSNGVNSTFQWNTAYLGASTSFGVGINAANSGIAWHDTYVHREGLGILGQRAGLNAQTFRLYNTYTDINNYERGFMRFVSNVFEIGTEKGTTGTVRDIKITHSYNRHLTVGAGGVYIAHGFGSSTLTGFVPDELRLSSNTLGFSNGNAFSVSDTGLARQSAGVIKVTNGSTGAGQLIFIVPTTDPGITGALWNNAGTLSISA